MENENQEKTTSFIAQLITFLLFLTFAAGMIYCSITIYKGIIREAVIEAIEHTRAKVQ